MSGIELARLREVAEAATSGPWGDNGYSTVVSSPMLAADDEFWTDERLEDGHTYGHRVGHTCPACGERPAYYSGTALPEFRGKRFGTYWDCARHKDAYDVDPVVASVPAQYGDTATGRHAADARYISTFDPPTVVALLDRLAAVEALFEEARRAGRHVNGYAYVLARDLDRALHPDPSEAIA